MSTLHIINTSSTSSSSLQSCLRGIQKDSAVILIEDAVIIAKEEGQSDQQIKNTLQKLNWFVLEPDLKARGIKTEDIIEGIKPVNYQAFVKLAVKYDRTQTWS